MKSIFIELQIPEEMQDSFRNANFDPFGMLALSLVVTEGPKADAARALIMQYMITEARKNFDNEKITS